MNYIQITIGNRKVGLKFGMASFRYISDKFVDGISFNGGDLNEIGVAHLIYSGYYNNCLVKQTPIDMTFEDVVDFVEANLNNDEFMKELTEVIKIWSESDFIKQTQKETEEPKKKNSRGKK